MTTTAPRPLGLPPIDLNQAYSVVESCQYLRCSRSFFYRMLEAGLFAVVRRGARTFLPGTELARLAQPQSREQEAANRQALRSTRPQPPDALDTPKRGRGRPRTRAAGASPPASRS
jgi:hypothetical protein